MQRRDFLKNSSSIAAGITILNFPVFGKNAPSNKVVLGVMGVNSRGAYLAKSFSQISNVEVAYLCDVEEKAVQNGMNALKEVGKEAKLIHHSAVGTDIGVVFPVAQAVAGSALSFVEGLAEHQRGAWGADALRLIRVDASAGAIPSVANLDTTDRHWAHAVFDFAAKRAYCRSNFPPSIELMRQGVIWFFASRKRPVIRCPLANDVSPIPR